MFEFDQIFPPFNDIVELDSDVALVADELTPPILIGVVDEAVVPILIAPEVLAPVPIFNIPVVCVAPNAKADDDDVGSRLVEVNPNGKDLFGVI